MDVEFAKAGPGDFAYIKEKIGKYLLDGHNINWQEFFVGKVGQRVVCFGRILDYGDSFEIASLGVDYYHRKKGLGKKILLYLIEQARQEDPQKPIYGVTHVPNFVRACGFVEIKSDYPEYLDDKRKNRCHLDPSKIKIVKWHLK